MDLWPKSMFILLKEMITNYNLLFPCYVCSYVLFKPYFVLYIGGLFIYFAKNIGGLCNQASLCLY